MSNDEEGDHRRRRAASSEKEGAGADVTKGNGAIQDGRLVVSITEMQIWSKLSRGDYNRNQAYAHVVVAPSVPWMIEVPVSALEGPEALKQALSVLQDAVHAAVKEKAAELERSDRRR